MLCAAPREQRSTHHGLLMKNGSSRSPRLLLSGNVVNTVELNNSRRQQ